MKPLEKVKRGPEQGDPQPLQLARKVWGWRPGGLGGTRGVVEDLRRAEQDTHFRKSPGKVTWGH